jgi:hypothetical protein
MRFSLTLCLAFVSMQCAQPRNSHPDTLRIAVVGPLEPLSASNQQGFSRLAYDWVYQPLANVDDSGQLKPVLASSVEKLPNGGLRFRLREEATFSDGTQVQIQDVENSFEGGSLRVRRAGSSFEVQASKAGLPVEALVSLAPVFRRVQGKDLGSGPLAVVSENAQVLTLRRREPKRNRPEFVKLIAYETPREALARTLKGDADILPRLEPRLAEFLEGVSRFRLVHWRTTQAAALAFSLRLTRNQRKGLAAALPRREIAKAAFGDNCKLWPDNEASNGPLPHRIFEIAAPILDSGFERLGLAVRRSLGSHSGVLHLLPLSEAHAAISEGRFDIFATPVLIWPPIMAGLTFRTGTERNIQHYSDPAVDEALDAGDWGRALKALQENPPLLFICLPERLFAIDSRIKDPRISASVPFEFLPEWEFTE